MSQKNKYNVKRHLKLQSSKTKTKKKKKKKKKKKNLPLSPSICTPPFCDELPKGNQDSSSKGGGGEDRQAPAKSAHKA